jgi:hypothetical protein
MEAKEEEPCSGPEQWGLKLLLISFFIAFISEGRDMLVQPHVSVISCIF